MGWGVGEDYERRRHIGYGVPATCDYPGCGTEIDRGLGYACGGGVVGNVPNCGLFFCGEHLTHWKDEDASDGGGGENVCERCVKDEEPFDPTPDVEEWVEHVATDQSWAKWRGENPSWLDRMQKSLA